MIAYAIALNSAPIYNGNKIKMGGRIMKRLLSWILCIVMVTGLLPAISLATDAAETDPVVLTAYSKAAVKIDGSILELNDISRSGVVVTDKFQSFPCVF